MVRQAIYSHRIAQSRVKHNEFEAHEDKNRRNAPFHERDSAESPVQRVELGMSGPLKQYRQFFA
jgi:hypothetical protein